MLSGENYIKSINNSLPRGSRSEIAALARCTTGYVEKVLRGERNSKKVLEAAEDFILKRGICFLKWPEFSQIVKLIYDRKKIEQSYASLLGKIILTNCELPTSLKASWLRGS